MSVQAVAGTYVVLLGINMDSARTAGVFGFGIQRTDHDNGDKLDWLEGFKAFKNANLPRGALVPTNEHPVQAFLWGDYTARKGHRYTYRVVAMRGQPGNLTESEDVSVTFSMESEDVGDHAIYFNRGVAGSQAYEKKFPGKRPDEAGQAAYTWLSRGLEEAMVAFIQQAQDASWGLRAAVYEFQYQPVLKEFKAAIDRGADVLVVFDDRKGQNESPDYPQGPWKANTDALDSAGIGAANTKGRTKDPSYISHNKFIVLLHDGEPVQVWTGSTNITRGGIFGHSNVGHIVRRKDVASAYLEYWKQLYGDPDAKALRKWDDSNSPVPATDPPEDAVIEIFSPRTGLGALQWYASRMNIGAPVFFTAAFGVNKLFEQALASRTDLSYMLLEAPDDHMQALRENKFNRIAVGSLIPENAFEGWLQEHLTGFNEHVKYVHTKYMLIDPLGNDPVVITGSANFSDASTKNNDENMLVIRGSKYASDVYLSEFMRLFMHYYFRSIVNERGPEGSDPEAGYLKGDDSWVKPYYRSGTPKYLERIYFCPDA
jgi:phosphatidylserine/phosphatidylglycerophosphate/cardiolipin synthase-like enzyme